MRWPIMQAYRVAVLIALAVLIAVAGCGGATRKSEELKRMQEMHNFALAYHNYYSGRDRAPSKLKDLDAQRNDFPGLYQEIDTGQFVVIWNAKLLGDGDKNDKFLLAYPRGAEEHGGTVVMGGGFVREMTAEEFRTTPKLETAPAERD